MSKFSWRLGTLAAGILVAAACGSSVAAGPAQYDWEGNLISGIAMSSTGDPRLIEVADYVNSHIKPWLNDPLIIKMINAQNAETKKLKQTQIDTLDIAWLERSDHFLIDARMNNELSTFLRNKRDADKDVIQEIFVYDYKGMNVGETDLTQDYVQGDETKFWKSFGSGPDGMVVEKIAPNGGLPNVSQVSFAIKDPSTDKPIGAVTIGINYDGLSKTKK